MNQEQLTVARALYRDAIVQFMACFEGPSCLRFDEIYGSSAIEGALSMFQHLKDYRDSVAAHRFGPARQFVIAIDPVTRDVHRFVMLELSMDRDEIAKVGKFMMMAKEHVDERIKRLGSIVLKQARELTAEQISSLSTAQLHTLSIEDHRQTRKKFAKSRDRRKK